MILSSEDDCETTGRVSNNKLLVTILYQKKMTMRTQKTFQMNILLKTKTT